MVIITRFGVTRFGISLKSKRLLKHRIILCKNLNKGILPNIEEIRRLMWPRRKKNSLARITLLSCMQDNLLIDYEVYQIAHEMWETLKENYGGLSTTKLRKLVMKFGNYKMRLNYTMKQHIREMKRMIR